MSFGLVVALLLVAGCGDKRESREARPTIEGFDFFGEKTTCPGLKLNEACPQLSAEATDLCLNEGFEVRYCQDCTLLCSGSTSE
jgi:hypothetical protein